MAFRDYGRRAWTFLRTLHTEFSDDNGAMVAGSMSFYALLSVFPILIVAVAAIGYVLGSPERAYAKVFEYVGQFSPALAQEQGSGIREILEGVVRGRGTAGGIGLLVLLWSGSQFFVSLEKAVNIAWQVTRRRSFLWQRLVSITTVFIAGLLLLVSLGVTTVARIVIGFRAPILGIRLSDFPWTWAATSFLLTLFVTVAMFTIVYKVLPNRRVHWLDAAVGGVVAGALWEITKQAFSWYVPRFANYSKIYGSLGGVVILMVWIYYSSIVTVIGAEVAAIRAKSREKA